MAETKSDIPKTGSNAGGAVLVAVDFSADSEAALVWACQYANLVGAHVLILHVVHDPGEAPGYYRRRDEDALRPMEDVAKEMLEEFLAGVREKLDLANVPDLVKGTAAAFLVAGILSMSFMGFAGLGR